MYEIAATTIIAYLHKAEADLIGRTVVTFNGETGTVAALTPDDIHGLRFTFDPSDDDRRRWYPVSTIKSYGAKG